MLIFLSPTRHVPWFLTMILLIGCSEENEFRPGAFQVSDSAGIEILFSATPAQQGENAWSVSPEPVLQIGELEGEAPFLFASIWGASQASDGRIIVSEGQSYEIRVFSPAGEALETFGRPGEGPSEFGGPPWIRVTPPDTLVVWDPGHYRLSWFALGGDLLKQVSLRSVIADLHISRFVDGSVWEFGQGGTLLSTGPGNLGMGPGLQNSTRRLVFVGDAGETVHDFGEISAGQTLRVRRSDGGSIGIGNRFAPQVQAALGLGPFPVVLSGERRWELQLKGADGGLRRLIRADIPQTPVTQEILDGERNRLPERVSGTGLTLGQLEAAFNSLPIPDSIQAIGRIEVDVLGNLWVGRRTGERGIVLDYDIFDTRGQWLTSVNMPSEIDRILEIGRKHIIGVWRDEFDIPYLRLYGIEKPANRG